MTKKKNGAAEKRRKLMKGPGAMNADKLAARWVVECLEDIARACERRQNRTEITVKSVEARYCGYGYEKFVEEFEDAALLTVKTLAVDDALISSHKFKKNEAKTLTGGMFSEEKRDYPESYDLVISIRW